MRALVFGICSFAASVFYVSALIGAVRIALATGIPGARSYPADTPTAITCLAVAAFFSAIIYTLPKDPS